MEVSEVVVVGGLLVAVLSSWGRRYWQAWEEDREEKRLIRAFLELARDVRETYNTLVAPLSANKAATRANVRDPEPVLERLLRKGHIQRVPNDPEYYTITSGGRARALESRPWWRFW